jgi:hypothetical protein
MQRQIRGGAMAFNIDTPTLEQIGLAVLEIVALVAVVAWLSHRRRARLNDKWITLVQNASSQKRSMKSIESLCS